MRRGTSIDLCLQVNTLTVYRWIDGCMDERMYQPIGYENDSRRHHCAVFKNNDDYDQLWLMMVNIMIISIKILFVVYP